MILLFSETRSDYSQYLYPYVIWGVPEPGETPADLFRQGFLPASPQLDRWYLCRNLRVDLRQFEASSENRRILRKGEGISLELIPRTRFDYSGTRRAAWKAYADARFGPDVMSLERLDRLMGGAVISHLLQFTDRAEGREVGTVLMFLEEPAIAYYYYAFYDLEFFARSLGLFMMTSAVAEFARRGVAYFHHGTCYSRRALYKTQFAGLQFFNGFRWSGDLAELKFLLAREEQPVHGHLLEMPDYQETFYDASVANMAAAAHLRVRPGPGSGGSHPSGRGGS
jgi:arginyl-tRNA--protein-N-Asp/Glu arginylyltransferase